MYNMTFVSFKAKSTDCGNNARLVKSKRKMQKISALFENDGLKTKGKRTFDAHINIMDVGKSICHSLSDFFFKINKPACVSSVKTGIILFDRPVASARASGNSLEPYLKTAKTWRSPS